MRLRIREESSSDRCCDISGTQIDLTSNAARSRRDGSSSSARDSSATVVSRRPTLSCSASMAVSAPTSRSKRKQSTTVRAGVVMRAGTPSNSVDFTPNVQAAPLNRTTRSRSPLSRGFRAACGIPSHTSAGAWLPIWRRLFSSLHYCAVRSTCQHKMSI